MDEARVGRAAGGAELRLQARDLRDGALEHVADLARRRQKGFAADLDRKLIAPARGVELFAQPGFELAARPLIVEADVEHRARRARNDVGGGIADIDGRDLQIGRRKALIAAIDRLGEQAPRASRGADARRCRRDADRRCGPGRRDGEEAVEAAAPADLDHVAELLGAGRLADDAGIERLAALRHPVEELARAVDRRGLLVAGDEEADRAVEIAAVCEEARRGGDETGDRALHVGGAAAIERAVEHLAAERIDRPALEIARRHDVGMAGEAEIAARVAAARVEIEDRRGAFLRELDNVAGKAQPFERLGEERDRALVLRRHGRPADERGGEFDRVERHQSRSSSLIEVRLRVFASTRLTMTQQARLGPGVPSASGLPGRLPGTTTE